MCSWRPRPRDTIWPILPSRLGADLTVVGPELPLVAGHRRRIRAPPSSCSLAPRRQAAQLEGSKIFAKQFLARHSIPTGRVYGMCDSAAERTRPLPEHVNGPVVLKADGLCAGKGVLVTASQDEARAFIARVMESREFGEGGARLLIEEALTGPELSYMVLTDGEHFVSLGPTP